MADLKWTQFEVMTTYSAEDLISLIDNPNGTPVNKKSTLANFLKNLPANTAIDGTLTVSGDTTFNGSNSVFNANVNIRGAASASSLTISNNHITVENQMTPANSSITLPGNRLWWDENYIYVSTANNVIKRAALGSF